MHFSSIRGSKISVSACAPLEHEIGCGKISYTDFTSLSNAPEAHRLKCSRGAQALLVRWKRITLSAFISGCAFLLQETQNSCIFRLYGEHKSKRGHFDLFFCLKTIISFFKETFFVVATFPFSISRFS